MTCSRMGQFSSAGSMRLKKYGVMPSASLVLASFAPAVSSGVSVGQKFLQLLDRGDAVLDLPAPVVPVGVGTSRQKPRPADENFFKD